MIFRFEAMTNSSKSPFFPSRGEGSNGFLAESPPGMVSVARAVALARWSAGCFGLWEVGHWGSGGEERAEATFFPYLQGAATVHGDGAGEERASLSSAELLVAPVP